MIEITPELYVDLTIKMLPLLIERLLETFERNKEQFAELSTPQEGLKVLFGILLEVQQAIGEEVLPEGLTNEAMKTYKKEHGEEIRAYLQSHPALKEKLKVLESQFKQQILNAE
ncbi:MAG: hypothetical protein ACTSRS_09635 [Candidatus Helarchaeota archaeon]